MARRIVVADREPVIAGVSPSPLVKTAEVEFFPEIEQRSDDWFELRRGIPTASEFSAILAEGEGKMRRSLLYRLAGELMTGTIATAYRNGDMERGIEMEPDLREAYGASRFCSLAVMGFVRRRLPGGRWVGCSPDALVDQAGVLEIKTHKPEILIPILERGLPPTEHRPQCQGTLWVTGRAWCDLKVGFRGMPSAVFRFERDESYIKRLSDAVEVFDYDLHQLVAKLRRMG